MKKISVIMAAALLGIFIMLGILNFSNVVNFREIVKAIVNAEETTANAEETTANAEETTANAVETTVSVAFNAEALQDLVTALNRVADNQEAMKSTVAQHTSKLDTSNETFHKEVIAILKAKGLHCCCCQCTGEKAPETQAPVVTTCSHANTKYTIGDGVHYTKCASCGKVLATANCKFNSNGYCYTCGGYRKPAETTAPETTAPACTHATTKYVPGNGVHYKVCSNCAATIDVITCTYTSGNCVCGNACVHSTEVKAGNGVHYEICTKCGVTVSTMNCTYTSGKCVCGNACVHSTEVKAGNGVHYEVCTKCGVTVSTVNCTYTSGKCVCGNDCAHTTEVRGNIGKHNYVCTKCNVTVSTENCSYNTAGYCTVCGVRCAHSNVNHVPGNDGTHTAVCTKCKAIVDTVGCTYNSAGYCTKCGAKEVTPAKPDNSTSAKPDNSKIEYIFTKGDVHIVMDYTNNTNWTETCTYRNGRCTKCNDLKSNSVGSINNVANQDNTEYAKPDDFGSAKPDNSGSAKPDNFGSAKPDNSGSAKPDNSGSAKPDNNKHSHDLVYFGGNGVEHMVYCESCDMDAYVESCTMRNGVCKYCGESGSVSANTNGNTSAAKPDPS